MTPPFEQGPALATVPGLVHGFFGRRGGVSTGDHAGLNVSTATGDDPAAVAANRAAAAAALGYPPAALTLLRQVHSATALEVDATLPPDAPPEADGMVTRQRGLLLGILTADCAPVLLADPVAGVVGAFHAGWKGAVAGIAAATVDRMIGLGAEASRIVAAIGPTISGANYEVGADFAADLLARHPEAAHRIFTPAGGREHFDLPGFVADRLRACGVAAIDDLARCTYASPAHYFSHRHATHSGTVTGRQVALIGLS